VAAPISLGGGRVQRDEGRRPFGFAGRDFGRPAAFGVVDQVPTGRLRQEESA